MTIDPKQSVAGCGILRIRAFVRNYANREFDLIKAAQALEVNANKAAAVLEWLEVKKYIVPVASTRRKLRWTGTDHAGAFANASARKGISRTTATRLLEELLDRAAQLNRAREFAYFVGRITVWGSYLGTGAMLGDLDVAVGLKPVEHELHLRQRLEEKRIRAAYASGRRMRNLVEQFYWPQEEVFRFLRGRSRSYHFVSPDDRIFQQAPQKVVFEATAVGPS